MMIEQSLNRPIVRIYEIVVGWISYPLIICDLLFQQISNIEKAPTDEYPEPSEPISMMERYTLCEYTSFPEERPHLFPTLNRIAHIPHGTFD